MQPDRVNTPQPTIGDKSLADLLSRECVQARVICKSWREAIEMAIAPLVKLGAVDPSYTAAVIEREQRYPTGLPTEPYGVALPHADGLIHRPAFSLLTLREPVMFEQMGDPDVQVAVQMVITLAIPPHDQINAIEALAHLIQQQPFLIAAQTATTDELYKLWCAWTDGPKE